MPPNRKQVVVLYAETKLQKSIDLPGNVTVARAKQEGMVAIKEHLNTLSGVPPVSIDPDCTDFYPAPKDNNTTICSLKGNLTMVVYPESPNGQLLTPSPFVDALQSAIHEVRDINTQKNVAPLAREESTKCYIKPVDHDMLLLRFEAMEERFGRDMTELRQVNTALMHNVEELRRENTELRRENNELRQESAGIKHDIGELRQVVEELRWENTGLKHDVEELRWENTGLKHDVDELAGLKTDIEELKQDNARLKYNNNELSDKMDETTRAVLGDKVAIDKIRRQVLLDMGRDQLAIMCGHKGWREWKDGKANSNPGDDLTVRTAIMTEAEVMFQGSNDISEYWKAIGQDHPTLRLLIHPNHIRTYGDIAAHTSTEKAIAESILGLTAVDDRTHMIAIFRAVYDNEP